ncbi:MAG: hypothetical protein GF418_16145 [Chitinivibrionales bacterium]|nr:hypothetical protein [Chitinivibrionales bacterium]MBD3397152.1 hypothetical protein [Chitinivibrionales bacterium]
MNSLYPTCIALLLLGLVSPAPGREPENEPSSEAAAAEAPAPAESTAPSATSSPSVNDAADEPSDAGAGGEAAAGPDTVADEKDAAEAEEAVVEEEDILLIEGEEEESIIAEEVGVTEEEPDTAAGGDAGEQAAGAAGEEPGAEEADAEEKAAAAAAAADTVADTVVPEEPEKKMTVEQARSINFAKNLEEYRSPRTAMFMSLFLPGLGQAYAKRPVKTGIFVLAEAAIIGTGVYFALEGRDHKATARKYADRNFDLDKFWSYYENIVDVVPDTWTDSMKQDLQRSIVWDSTEFAQDAKGKNNAYYDNLQREALVHGWEDAEPVLDAPNDRFIDSAASYSYNYEVYQEVGDPEGDTNFLFIRIDRETGKEVSSKPVWGYSESQQDYIDMVHEYNRYYRISTNVLFLLFANHVVSAVDAMISAKAHNDELLGRQSFWRHVGLNQQLAFTENGITSTLGVRIRF